MSQFARVRFDTSKQKDWVEKQAARKEGKGVCYVFPRGKDVLFSLGGVT